MRVLVEQTYDCVEAWLKKLGLDDRVALVTLMGGVDTNRWDQNPERETIIIGTQDMLLSRALNRGYGMSRFRWPMHFGLLNNDCLWVMDEVQLMGAGLATTAQLESFRRSLGTFGAVHSIWMSATISRDWLRTVDFNPDNHERTQTLTEADWQRPALATRMNAPKPLQKGNVLMGEFPKLATEILSLHAPKSRTLVVANTVERATEVYSHLLKKKTKVKLVLIHSRFRSPDRAAAMKRALDKPGATGVIVVATQVIEAGVDFSSRVLITELAPWASLVQRFGRCNRGGDEIEPAVFWLDLPKNKPEKFSRPYDLGTLERARNRLMSLPDVGPASIPKVKEDYEHQQIIRRKDLFELFDTTTDLAGFDLDVSRFIRDDEELDVQVFWRNFDTEPADEEKPSADELCRVPIGQIKAYINKNKGWVPDSLDGRWVPVADSLLRPGLTIILSASKGGYDPSTGWSLKSSKPVPVLAPSLEAADSYDGDPHSECPWESIAEHTGAVIDQAQLLSKDLIPPDVLEVLVTAAKWHDAGKAHPAFQACLRECPPSDLVGLPAKAPRAAWVKGRIPNQPAQAGGRRKHFRHELASAILALMHNQSDLVAYLCAAHHGKVRVSIRSMPEEYRPKDACVRFARGVWDGDVVPEVLLADGLAVPETSLDLSFLDLGEGPRGESWMARILKLRNDPALGPFRLALLEALIKAADERGSALGAPIKR
jgi:CRISPR-associated endonuclease/helicase Cas3